LHDWDRIVSDHGPMVFRIAWRILGDASDADDVVQEVFLEAHRVCRQARTVRRWPGLLRRLATYRALDLLRRRKHSVALDGLSLVDPGEAAEEKAAAEELAGQLRAAVARLSEHDASVFCLRYFEHLSNHEIAENLNVTPSAVSTALHRARTRLQTLLAGVIQGESR
jgi:RNA polymerase sigma-70 factor (ECF subfamily)